MGDSTEISWTDHTFNPWWGCTKIAPGCDNCYAAALDKRTGGDHWEGNKPRRTSVANWSKPLKWNKQASIEGRRHRVFCGSMMDWCDKNAPEGALDTLWQLIRETPWLDWQLLTKRATLIQDRLPPDWGRFGYKNVWLGVTVENQEFGFPRIEALSKVPAKVRFLSCEPLLGPLTGLSHLLRDTGIGWIIVGGESGPGCRVMHPAWAETVIATAHQHGIPVWFKQWGGNTKDKGGCVVGNRIIHEWPRSVLTPQQGEVR